MKGDYFGESCVCSNSKWIASAKAFTDCVCLEISSEDFKWIFDY